MVVRSDRGRWLEILAVYATAAARLPRPELTRLWDLSLRQAASRARAEALAILAAVRPSLAWRTRWAQHRVARRSAQSNTATTSGHAVIGGGPAHLALTRPPHRVGSQQRAKRRCPVGRFGIGAGHVVAVAADHVHTTGAN